MASILVIAAHPDDEVLGCGGTIARHARHGDAVNIVIVAEGATSRLDKRDRNHFELEISDLKLAAEEAASILGAQSTELLDFPDNRLDGIDRIDLIKRLEYYVDKYRPEIVYLHHSGDVNIDHRRLHEAVTTACRPTPGHSVRKLLSFEIASSTEWQPPTSGVQFQPNVFVDIGDYWELKRLALEAYTSEMRAWPHPRSIKALEHLARLRGAQVGVEAAEAFVLLREIV